jgi:hypothetical protein
LPGAISIMHSPMDRKRSDDAGAVGVRMGAEVMLFGIQMLG